MHLTCSIWLYHTKRIKQSILSSSLLRNGLLHYFPTMLSWPNKSGWQIQWRNYLSWKWKAFVLGWKHWVVSINHASWWRQGNSSYRQLFKGTTLAIIATYMTECIFVQRHTNHSQILPDTFILDSIPKRHRYPRNLQIIHNYLEFGNQERTLIHLY